MKLIFRIQYRTVWGENVYVMFNDDNSQIVPLATRDGIEWQGSCDYPLSPGDAPITYRYAIYRDKTCIRKELGAIGHLIYPGNAQQSCYILDDCWRDLPTDNYRYSSAFNTSYTPAPPVRLNDHVGSCITFRALCPGLSTSGKALGIIGSCNALGNWESCRPIRMREVQPNVWQLTMDASSLKFPFEYKFVSVSSQTGAVEEWETRDNRIFHVQPLQRGETYFPMETEVCLGTPQLRIAGSAIPVFSLRSEGSCGVGDFGDLKTFITWAAETGQRIVQILPINDTTMTHSWTDSYPYNSISIYAFHPMYVDLRQLPVLEDTTALATFEAERIRLNSLSAVDYEEVNKLKNNYLKQLFEQEYAYLEASSAFNDFVGNNRDWLMPYAAYCYLRDRYQTSDFRQWDTYSTYHKEQIEALCSPNEKTYKEIAFHYFVQYVLHIQLTEACQYGRSKGVILKGDIPIGISRTSVEAWMEPHYFNMNGQAGAPPDAFSTNGQNWGMPTYNWEIMAKDNYSWWKKRFRKMAEYFTAYRIDHILGFFRIWEIPYHSVHGLLGQFVPSLPMSKEEIQSFGLAFDKETMTRPFINDYILNTVFGEQSEEVRKTFVRHLHHDVYDMRPEFNTQRKVETYFAGKTDKESMELKEKLYSLISDVLFIADRDNPELYHPRIAVQKDFVYQQLREQDQEAFNRLYNHYYYQRHNEFWYHEAMKKLPVLIQSTPMLVCGEDLGMVPDCVPWVMKQLQILSLEIQRMPKSPANEFGKVNEYPFQSVCTIGTHDMSTFRGWWEEDKEQTERFYHQELGHWGEVPAHAPDWICEEVIRQHLESPSMLCVLTWQDWTSMDEKLRNPNIDAERINVPANPRHYWRWRMHITLEELIQYKEFNEKIQALIKESGRS